MSIGVKQDHNGNLFQCMGEHMFIHPKPVVTIKNPITSDPDPDRAADGHYSGGFLDIYNPISFETEQFGKKIIV